MANYQEISLLCLLNLWTANWDTKYPSEELSNKLSIALIIIILVLPLLISLVFRIPVEKWRKQNFVETFGTLTDGKRQSKFTVMISFAIFFIRKLVFVWSVIKLQDYLWLQITLQIISSAFNIAFIQLYKQFDTVFTNRMGTFDEINTLVLIYTALCFTDYVLDPYIKSNNVGPTYISIIVTLIAVHIIIMLVSSLKSVKQICKKFYKRITRRNKRRQDHDDNELGENSNITKK